MAFSFFGISTDGTTTHQRLEGVAGEWEAIPSEERNCAQRIAARTNGIVTLPNLISIAGAALTARGIYNIAEGVKTNDSRRIAIGIGQVGVGRIADIADGTIATKQGVRSDRGALLDSGLDKTLAAYSLYKLSDAEVISKQRALAHGAEQLGIAVVSVGTQRYGGEPNPSAAGKAGAAAMWLGFGASGVETYCVLTNNATLKPAANTIAHIADTYALAANGYALGQYTKQFIETRDQHTLQATQ